VLRVVDRPLLIDCIDDQGLNFDVFYLIRKCFNGDLF
jgi:hypothetical protein